MSYNLDEKWRPLRAAFKYLLENESPEYHRQQFINHYPALVLLHLYLQPRVKGHTVKRPNRLYWREQHGQGIGFRIACQPVSGLIELCDGRFSLSGPAAIVYPAWACTGIHPALGVSRQPSPEELKMFNDLSYHYLEKRYTSSAPPIAAYPSVLDAGFLQRTFPASPLDLALASRLGEG